MNNGDSNSSDTDSVSSDSGIDSSHSSSSSANSDFMDLDEFLLMSNAARAVKEERKECLAVVKNGQDSNTAEPATSNMNSPEQLLKIKAESDQQASVPVTEHPESETAYANAMRRRKYVYNPLPIESKAKRKFIPSKEKDSEYWNRRMKNNVAAKRSRDMRRKKEMEVNERYKELEEENSRLKAEIQILQANAVHLERKIAGIVPEE